MELHVRIVLLIKMPIILISVDSKNTTLNLFDKMKDTIVDIVLESPDERSKAIGDLLESKMTFTNRLAIDRLDEDCDEDPGIRMEAVFNMLRSMKVRTAIIISHHSVFNSWEADTIGDEWDIIGM
jgi:hypothetical protein